MHDKATSSLKRVVVRKLVLSDEDVIRSRVYYIDIVMSIKIFCGKYNRKKNTLQFSCGTKSSIILPNLGLLSISGD